MKIKRILPVLLCLMLLLGCQAPTPEQTTTVPTTGPMAAFTGDAESYAPRYTRERDAAWEEDILFLAEKYLTEHSYLSDANFFIQYQPDLSGITEYLYENTAYDPEKRAAFIESVDALLAAIPELTDEQISYELVRIVAALGDVHSNVWPETKKLLTVFYEPFYHENGVDYRVTAVDSRKQELMLGRLVSYNGIGVEELVERVSAYVSCESERSLGFRLAQPLGYTALNDRDILVAAGIADTEDTHLTAEFETAEGLVEMRLPFRTEEQIVFYGGVTGHPMLLEENLRYSREDPYWWTMIDETTLYMQLTTMLDVMEGYTIDNLISEVRTAIRDAGEHLKLILDFRGNGGGYVHESALKGLVSSIEWYGHDGVYILIDGNCFSAGVLAPYYLRQAIDDALLVGAPTGQGLRFPANSSWYELPNNGIGFSIGDEIICAVRDWDTDALEPDVTVYQTLEDYENMVDSALAWAMAD